MFFTVFDRDLSIINGAVLLFGMIEHIRSKDFVISFVRYIYFRSQLEVQTNNTIPVIDTNSHIVSFFNLHGSVLSSNMYDDIIWRKSAP